MESKLLDGIIHGELKPWLVEKKPQRFFSELVIGNTQNQPANYSELIDRISILLREFPKQLKSIKDEEYIKLPILEFDYKIKLPSYTNAFTKYYLTLISLESLRFYNSVIFASENWSDITDVRYQVGKILNNLKVLSKQTAEELKIREYDFNEIKLADDVGITLQTLLQSLITVYFNIQSQFQKSLEHIITLKDFYLLNLELPEYSIQYFENNEIAKEADKLQINSFSHENAEIELIEIELRKFIIEKFGITNYSEYKIKVPTHIQDKIKANIEKEEKKNPGLIKPKTNEPSFLLQFSDLQELQGIITSKDNWIIVQDLFGTKENLAIEFNNLSGLRNPIRHSRLVDEVSHLKGVAAIKWFKQQLKLK